MVELSLGVWVFAVAVALFAGVVKGAVGFAMPMIMISGLGTVLSPELALAGLILPTLLTNVWQAVRGGLAAAFASARVHWRYIVIALVMILFSAQLVAILPDAALFLILGVPVTVFAISQLLGWRLRFPPSAKRRAEIVIGAIAGFIGGVSGVWGPPTVAYLTALDTPKLEQVRVQGVVYALGAITLTAAHINSGVFNAATAPFSALLVLPALLGMTVGFRIMDSLDQEKFRRATLIVLAVAGLNLIRRALM